MHTTQKDTDLIMIDSQYVALLETGDLLFFNNTGTRVLEALIAGGTIDIIAHYISIQTGKNESEVRCDIESFVKSIEDEGIKLP